MLTKILPVLLLILLTGLPAWSASPADWNAPRGRVAELHSCELFAGSCVVSSEVGMANHYALRVWQFEGGQSGGVALKGLTVALLEKSDVNLADASLPARSAVAYLPEGISSEQKAVLTAWARANTTVKLGDADIKSSPLQAQIAQEKVTFSAGKDIVFNGGTPAPCPVGGCGEMLWYQPRSATSTFVVDEVGQSRIIEPQLALRWMDHGRRTLFVGLFGYPDRPVPALCGAAKTAAL